MVTEEAVQEKLSEISLKLIIRHIVYTTLGALAKEGKIKETVLEKAKKDLEIKPDKLNPMIS